MTIPVTPFDILRFAIEEANEFRSDHLSLKKAIRAFLFFNHLPEHIWHAHHSTAPQKVDSMPSANKYRNHLESICPEIGIIRDLCNYAKHVSITRYNPSTRSLSIENHLDGNEIVMSIIGIPTERNPAALDLPEAIALLSESTLIVTMGDGRSTTLRDVFDKAESFFTSLFQTKSL